MITMIEYCTVYKYLVFDDCARTTAATNAGGHAAKTDDDIYDSGTTATLSSSK